MSKFLKYVTSCRQCFNSYQTNQSGQCLAILTKVWIPTRIYTFLGPLASLLAVKNWKKSSKTCFIKKVHWQRQPLKSWAMTYFQNWNIRNDFEDNTVWIAKCAYIYEKKKQLRPWPKVWQRQKRHTCTVDNLPTKMGLISDQFFWFISVQIKAIFYSLQLGFLALRRMQDNLSDSFFARLANV